MAQLGTDALALSLVQRLSLIVMWLVIAVIHLTLIVITITVLWWLQIPPETLAGRFALFARSLPVALAGGLGLSALTILALWVRLCRKAYAKVTTPFLFRDANEIVRS